MNDTILSLKNITKEYPGVVALNNVSLELQKGETHALMGENGAGKSTLMKVLSGAIMPDAGEVVIDGKSYSHMTPKLSRSLGIEVIYQEFNLMPTLSVAENIFVGESIGGRFLADQAEKERRTKEIFERMKVNIDPRMKVQDLSVAYMQLVEIAKALSKDVRILVMDEPTAPLTNDEVDILFEIVGGLKKDGVTIVYISHRMNEIFQVADRVTVMRDGNFISVNSIQDITREHLIKDMVGRELSETYPERSNEIGDVVLKVDKLTGNGVKDIGFEVHAGEVLGLSGLVGAGRTELVRMIFGADKKDSGVIYLEGKEFDPKGQPKCAVDAGIGLIPEDRKQQGVVLGLPIQWNVTLPILKKISSMSVLRKDIENKIVGKQVEELNIKTPSVKQLVKNLSGGNQQKVVLAKWLAAGCKVLIFDEPTRGIDVGAKQEIYKLMNKLCEEGMAIIMISSEMEEVIGMSDRIVILCEGEQKGVLDKGNFTQEKILTLASGE